MKPHFVLVRLTAMFLTGLFISALSACGQRGPLYMPDANPPGKKILSPPPQAAPEPQTAPAELKAPIETEAPVPVKPGTSTTKKP